MKNNYKIIISIVLSLVILLLGGTYAWLMWRTDENNETKIVTEVGAITIAYDSGASLTGQSIKPVSDKSLGLMKAITIKTSEKAINKVTFNLYLDINTLDEGLKEESFKYAIYKSSTLIKEGNFTQEYLNNNLVTCDKNNTSHIVLLENETVTASLSTYNLYIWIDGANYDNPLTMQNQHFNFALHASGENALLEEAKYPDITKIKEGTLAHKIATDYLNSEKIGVKNNAVMYYYDTEHNLMSDIGGNVRYYGAKPNNYIYFNCDDYSNQTKDTCELWRIIGVFNDKVKIIRNESIGNFSWDNKPYKVGSSNGNGSNDWTDARLMMLLNPGYETVSDIYSYEGSLYWNSKAGTCYAGSNNGTVSCDFTSSGLKNDITKNMIADVTWNLGGWENYKVYSNEIYKYERGTTVYSGRPLSWNGKVALMYPSDYGYAMDFSKCGEQLDYYSRNYGNSTCANNDWLRNGYQWLLTPKGSTYAWYIALSGSVSEYNNNYLVSSVQQSVRPTLFLDSELKVESDSDGSSTSPYKLIVN